MPYINVDTPLIRHRKFKKFKRLLNVDNATALGYLVSLWSNVLELAEDGEISKWSEEDIAEYACFGGEPDLFSNALALNGDGFIDIKGKRKFIHDWWDYAGRYLSTKYKTSNPNKLLYIKSLYKTDLKTDLKLPKDILQTDKIDNIDKIDKINIQKIREEYIKLKGWDLKTLSSNDFSRTAKAIKTLLLRTKGEVEPILKGLVWISKQNYEWTLETLDKKWLDFMKPEKPEGAAGRNL